jgi:pyruvyltransferase
MEDFMKRPINLFYFDINNFGDSVNPYIFNKVTGRPIHLCDRLSKENVIGIGSIANWATEHSTIIGAGLADKTHTIHPDCKIKLLRGPISGDIARECGNKSKFNYGDPVLLLPKLNNFTKTQKHKYGIIPHYAEYNDVKDKVLESGLNIKVIDITIPVMDFIQEVLSCKNIFSSSLHGLVLSDAFSIPNMRFHYSDKILGDGTKFLDYCLSVNKEDKSYHLDEILSSKSLHKFFKKVNITVDYDGILKSFKCLEEKSDLFVPWR